MKKLNVLLCVLLCTSFLMFISCEKNEEENVSSQEMQKSLVIGDGNKPIDDIEDIPGRLIDFDEVNKTFTCDKKYENERCMRVVTILPNPKSTSSKKKNACIIYTNPKTQEEDSVYTEDINIKSLKSKTIIHYE